MALWALGMASRPRKPADPLDKIRPSGRTSQASHAVAPDAADCMPGTREAILARRVSASGEDAP
jgi:hypothetical protein